MLQKFFIASTLQNRGFEFRIREYGLVLNRIEAALK